MVLLVFNPKDSGWVIFYYNPTQPTSCPPLLHNSHTLGIEPKLIFTWLSRKFWYHWTITARAIVLNIFKNCSMWITHRIAQTMHLHNSVASLAFVLLQCAWNFSIYIDLHYPRIAYCTQSFFMTWTKKDYTIGQCRNKWSISSELILQSKYQFDEKQNLEN